MPVVGSEQQRYKTQLDTQLEILSIERELKKLDQERVRLAADLTAGNKTLQKEINDNYDELWKNLDKQKRLEEKVYLASVEAENQRDEILKAGAESRFSDLKYELLVNKLRTSQMRDDLELKKSQLIIERQIQSEIDAAYVSFLGFLGKLTSVFKYQKDFFDRLSKIPRISKEINYYASSLLAVFAEVFVMFLKAEEGLAKFRIYMGMTRVDAKRISKDILSVATSLANVGITIDGAVDATKALANEFGGTMKISRDLVETTSLLKAQLGVAEESSAGFLRNIAALSKSTAQAQRYMAFVTNELTAAAGIPLHLVMQDVAKMSGNALAMVSRIPLQLVKSAVAARQMGTSVNKMADASRQILNFTENVQAEMEASVLLGESINLQKARELAYNRDIVGSTKAIFAEARRINFEQLDVFQMEAFAAASGRSVDELLKMIQAQRQLREARNIDGLKDEVAKYEELQKLRTAQLEDSALQREMTIKQMANQERIVALQQQWNQLLMEATRVLYPVFDILLKSGIILIKILPSISAVVLVLAKMETIVSRIGFKIINWSKSFGIFFKIGTALASFAPNLFKVSALFTKILTLGGFISKLSFFGNFLKVIPGIGLIITGIQFAYNLWQRLNSVGEAFKDGIIPGIWAGIKAIGLALFNTLIKPFYDAYQWISKWFKGHSPSKVGEMIIQGIAASSTKIFDALTDPWRRFLAYIVSFIPFVGGTLSKKIKAGTTGLIEDVGLIEKKIKVEPKANVVSEEIATQKAPVTTVASTQEQSQKVQDSATLNEILKALNLLNSNLMAGKIGMYIDGQYLSATLARQTSFRGGFGTNNIRV